MKFNVYILLLSIIAFPACAANKFLIQNKTDKTAKLIFYYSDGSRSQSPISIKPNKSVVYDRDNIARITVFVTSAGKLGLQGADSYEFKEADKDKDLQFIIKLQGSGTYLSPSSFKLDVLEMPSPSKPKK
jgi:hypothetical protein